MLSHGIVFGILLGVFGPFLLYREAEILDRALESGAAARNATMINGYRGLDRMQ